jgi:hypothetical protein
MRVLYIFLLITIGAAFASQPITSRPLSAKEAAALREPTALGRRILSALSHYPKASEQAKVPTGLDLLTPVPPIEVLHACGYISDSDISLSHQYHATLQPIPSGAPQTQPLLTMKTDRGELVFDTLGDVTLWQHQ